MAAYLFAREHGPALRDGRQRMTLAAPRIDKPSSGHADLGDQVQLALSARGDKRRERVADRRCILRAAVVITPDALVRIVDLRFHERDEHTARAEGIARILRQAEQGAASASPRTRNFVAKLAGFRSWKALYEWNAHPDRRGRPDEAGRVTREIIGWAA